MHMESSEYNKRIGNASNRIFSFAAAVKRSYFLRYIRNRDITMNVRFSLKNKIIEAGWTLFDISLIGLAIYIFFIK
jgi:hypothetical protein